MVMQPEYVKQNPFRRFWKRFRRLFEPKRESNYLLHARRELAAIGYDLNDKEGGPNKWVIDNLFALLKVFGTQEHSGSSAPYVAATFKKLALFKPLSPLTGEDSEWIAHDNDMFQNNRASHVFKDGKDGQAYDINGRIFREPNGCSYTSSESRVPVTFPYSPTTEYVDVPERDTEGS